MRTFSSTCTYLFAALAVQALPAVAGAAKKPAPAFTLDVAEQFRFSRNDEEAEQALEQSESNAPAPTDTTLDHAQAYLRRANEALGPAAAPAATRWLLGVANESDLARIRRAASAAKRQMGFAEQIARDQKDVSKESGGATEKAEIRRFQASAETLSSFIELLLVCARAEQGEAYQAACREAAVRLAEIREHPDPLVAGAALLWQSFAFDLGGRRDRALVALPEVLAKPERLPYDYLSRLLRCRILAEERQFSAAITLTIRIGQSCDKWFNEKDADPARRLAALVRISITKDWMAELKNTPGAVVDLEASLAQTQADVFTEVEPRVYRLERVAPLFVEPARIRLPVGARKVQTATEPEGAERVEPATATTTSAPSDSQPATSP